MKAGMVAPRPRRPVLQNAHALSLSPQRTTLPVRQAAVLGAPGDGGDALAARLGRLGVTVATLGYDAEGLRARMLRARPDAVIAVAAGPRAERAAQAALAPLLEGLRALAVPLLAAVSGSPSPAAELLLMVDDILLPPHDAEELLLRAALAARRRGQHGGELMSAGPLTLDVDGFRVWLAGAPISVTYTEFQLLRLLLLNRGKVLTRQVLLNKIWGYDYLGGLRTVDVHIRRLRAKIEGEAPHLIETVRHAGYRIAG